MSAFVYRKPADLPATIPVFPLTGVVLFPRSVLPLNVFEPRYLNMVDDALARDRLIGMIQPADGQGEPQPSLSAVGCAGRITNFSETDDGRYLITLTGIARFHVAGELDVRTPYRQVRADWSGFGADLSQRETPVIDRDALADALRTYAQSRGFQVDWDAAGGAPAEMLVNAVASACPFEPTEKQLLLEAETVADRCQTLVALLQLGAAPGGGAPLQ